MSIAENIALVKSRIEQTALRVNRNPVSITLIAVTKYSGITQINEAINAGITDIGENRVQDAREKFPLLAGKVTKHLIGSLQTNKVKSALEEFDFIHSVDRIELVAEIAKQADKMGKQVKFLIQLNISGEKTKHGINPDELPALLDKTQSHPHLLPVGLMTIAPVAAEPEEVRPLFRSLKEILQSNAQNVKSPGDWRFLSMGMSQDFEVAIEEGANFIRVGTALFRE